MAEPAEKRWTVEEFLAWDDGTDRRYELVGGRIVAMAPPSEAHAAIVANLTMRIGSQLRPPCRVLGEFGVRLPDRDDSFYQFDLAVTRAAADPARRYIAEPEMIIEVLSPSTALHDRGRKLDHIVSCLPSKRVSSSPVKNAGCSTGVGRAPAGSSTT